MRSAKGFTLIEILVVMVLIGSFLAFAVPKFRDIADVNIKSATRKLSGTVKYLYNEAVFKKNVYRLVFDLDNDEYWVEYLDGNQFKVAIDPLLQRKKLPSGIYFRDIYTERTAGKVDSGRDVFLVFLPTGFVDYGVIHLESESENYYTIATKPYTGGTRVFDEYVDIERIDERILR